MKKILLLVLFFATGVFAQTEIPLLKNYANDYTSTLDRSELLSIENALKSFDDSTSNQIVFLMISALDGYPLETFCHETATKNNIGSKKNNNGVLFFVAKDERKMRIEVGYGLEGALPDALASSILRNEVRPYFKQGDYYAGISSGLDAIIKATKGEYKAEQKSRREKDFGFSPILIFIVLIIISLIGRKGGKGGRGGGGGLLPLLILSSMGSGNRSSWGGSGGFGGSGGGGFGGFSGGGGSFGGGGASGSW